MTRRAAGHDTEGRPARTPGGAGRDAGGGQALFFMISSATLRGTGS